MTRKVLLLLSVVLAVPMFASRQIIPVAGHLPGAAGTAWTTDVTVTNTSAAPQVVDLIFHPSFRSAVTRTITLAPGETRLLADAVRPDDFGHPGEGWMGLLEIVAAGEVRATSRTFSGAGTSSGTYGSMYDAVDPNALSSHGVLTGLLSNSNFRTNVAFANPTDHEQEFRFEVRGREGEVRGGDTLRVPAMTTTQIPLSAYARTTDDDPSFSMSWNADDRGYAVGSVVDNRSGDPTGIGSVAVGTNRLFFPIVASTPGRENTFWTTSVAVTSTSDTAGTVTLHFTGSDSRVAERTVPLAPHGTFRTDDLFTFLTLGSGSGFLTVDTTVPSIGSARVFNTTEDRGTFGSSVPAQDRVVKATRMRIRGVRRDHDYRLNVGIANDDRVPASGTIRLFDDRGTEIESQHFSLNPATSAQFSMSRSEVEVHGGEVEIEVENGTPVTGIASQIDNRSGDTSVAEVEQENERQHEAEISFSPRSAVVGVPVTLTASLPGISGASFTWTFGDGTSASGQTVTHTFTAAGEFVVTVTASFAGGSTVRESEDITVTGAGSGNGGNATLDFTWTPSSPTAGQAVTFTASSSAAGTIKWQFPGDIRPSGNTVAFTFAANGSYEVEAELEREGSPTIRVEHTVVVGGGGGNPTTPGAASSMSITVSPSAPVHGQPTTFQATFDAAPAAGSVVKWKFPDNSRPTGNPVTFTFASAGTYEVEADLEQPGHTTIEKKISVTVK